MKLFKSILFGAIITLCSITISAQSLEVPADPAPNQLDFEHRTLIVQYTGTTCPYCYQMIESLNYLSNDNRYNDLFHLAVCHQYRNDPMNLTPDNISALSPTEGVPRVLVGFTEEFLNYGSENNKTKLISRINTCLSREMMAGLAVNSKVEGNTLKVKAQLKAVKEGKFSIGCWLLEDGIYEAQVNMGMINHNNVIRVAEEARGKEVGTVQAGKTADTEFTITLQDGWNKEKCHLLLFACVHSEYSNIDGKHDAEYIINNVITAPLNTAVPYKYLSNSAIDEIEANDEIQVAYWGGQLEVAATSPIKTLAIYNIQGQLMLQLAPATDSISLSLNDLPTGVYTVRVGNAQTVKTQKIIKQ